MVTNGPVRAHDGGAFLSWLSCSPGKQNRSTSARSQVLRVSARVLSPVVEGSTRADAPVETTVEQDRAAFVRGERHPLAITTEDEISALAELERVEDGMGT